MYRFFFSLIKNEPVQINLDTLLVLISWGLSAECINKMYNVACAVVACIELLRTFSVYWYLKVHCGVRSHRSTFQSRSYFQRYFFFFYFRTTFVGSLSIIIIHFSLRIRSNKETIEPLICLLEVLSRLQGKKKNKVAYLEKSCLVIFFLFSYLFLKFS